MRIRFLQVADSSAPGVPFLAGQVIDVACPTPEMLAWLKPRENGQPIAEVVRSAADDVVADAVAEPEVAVVRHTRKRERARVA